MPTLYNAGGLSSVPNFINAPTSTPTGSLPNAARAEMLERQMRSDAALQGLFYDSKNGQYVDWYGRRFSPQQVQGMVGGAGPSVTAGGPVDAYRGGMRDAQPQQAQPAMTAQDRVNARAQTLADARLQNQVAPQTKLTDLFGVGGGDWAQQFGNLVNPRQSQYTGFSPAGGLNSLIGTINSPLGPYGQLQQAAAYMAPAKADERARMYEADTAQNIAGMKYSTANKIAARLNDLIGGGRPLTSIETDYGAGAKLNPVNFRRFFVGAQ